MHLYLNEGNEVEILLKSPAALIVARRFTNCCYEIEIYFKGYTHLTQYKSLEIAYFWRTFLQNNLFYNIFSQTRATTTTKIFFILSRV